MAKRAPGKGAGAAAGGGRKRSRKAAEPADDAANFFLLDDDDGKRQPESEEEQEEQETAEQKRIRLAREYLQGLRAATLGGDGDEEHAVGPAGSGEDEEGGAPAGGLDDEELGERLRLEALEAQGRLQRRIAQRLVLPEQPDWAASAGPSSAAAAGASRYGSGRFARAHRLSPTALALGEDERTAFTVAKDGTVLKWDLETMQRSIVVRPGSAAAKAAAAAAAAAAEAADWVVRGPRQSPTSSLLAAALSSDGRLLAVGGGDRLVHVFDAGSGAHVRSYPGHRDAVSALAFRPGTHTLYSGSFDRTVKIWSLDDGAYVDTLFGHQAEVYCVDAAARAERVVSAGHDHTCRVWKIPEDSHLVFRSGAMAQYAVAYLTGSEWVSGGADGSLQVWNTLKKKPASVCHHAHAGRSAGGRPEGAGGGAGAPPEGRGAWATANVDTEGWVQSVAVCRGSDLVASGAGDGAVRLWAVQDSKHGGAGGLAPVASLPAPGYINALALGRSGRLCVAALGQEPRLGRWGRAGGARNGLLVHRWELEEAAGSDGE